MISFLISLVVGLTASLLIWSFFALLHRGKNYFEIKNTLNDIFNSSLELVNKIKNLFVLLLKDSLQSNTIEISELFTNKTFRKQKHFKSGLNNKCSVNRTPKVVITDSLNKENSLENELNSETSPFISECFDLAKENQEKAA